MKDIQDYSLKRHNTFGIDAKCRRFLEYENTQEAACVAKMLRESDTPYIIIGGGSNLLLTQDFEGIVVHSAVKGFSVDGCRARCGSGMAWDHVVEQSLNVSLYGAENLSLIPGDVGASAVQNIGAYGVEAKDLIESVTAVEITTGRELTIGRDECRYGYRDSRFKHEWKNRFLITNVTYRFSREFIPHLDYGNIRSELERRGLVNPTAMQLRQVIIDIRRAKLPDPEVVGNAGSFFMNPVVNKAKFDELMEKYPQMPYYTIDENHVKIPAGWMIDQCGWKGKSLGRAGVHDKQALVLVNRGGAEGRDIVSLYQAIQSDVKEKFGIEIFPEVNVI